MVDGPIRTPIYCDCHGTEVMGYLVNGRLVWHDRRHGQTHTKVLDGIELTKEQKYEKIAKIE